MMVPVDISGVICAQAMSLCKCSVPGTRFPSPGFARGRPFPPPEDPPPFKGLTGLWHWIGWDRRLFGPAKSRLLRTKRAEMLG